MEATGTILNKVAQSGLITFDLETLTPQAECVLVDLKDHLFQGLILREKDFRAFVKEHDWSQYTNKHVAVTCSADAIIPTWAYMLLANRLQPYANEVIFGDLAVLKSMLFRRAIDSLPLERYTDAKVMVKGCSDEKIPEDAYIYLTTRLSAVAQSIMYGEACSSVPVFKRTK